MISLFRFSNIWNFRGIDLGGEDDDWGATEDGELPYDDDKEMVVKVVKL